MPSRAGRRRSGSTFPGFAGFVPLVVAREIVGAVADRAEVVGVFVNEAPGTIVALCGRLGSAGFSFTGTRHPGTPPASRSGE